MLATKCTLGADVSVCVWDGGAGRKLSTTNTQNGGPPPESPTPFRTTRLETPALPKRVMSDVVSIADLMRRPNEAEGEFSGVGELGRGEACTFGKTSNMHLLDNATNDDDDDKDK